MQKKTITKKKHVVAAVIGCIACLGFILGGSYLYKRQETVFVMSQQAAETTRIYPCGFPVGIYVNTKGIMVVGTEGITTVDQGVKSPCEGTLLSGDYITAVDGTAVATKEELTSRIEGCGGQAVTLHVVRDDSELDVSLRPVMDVSGSYRLGVWVKDDVQGIGTLTYITEDGCFGALGHPINDTDTGKLVRIETGGLYQTQIQMIIRGENGSPGSFSGIICYDKDTFLGNVSDNSLHGIFGTASERLLGMAAGTKPVEVMKREEVHAGPAVMRCQIDGRVEDYDIEIIQTGSGDSKGSLQVKVTDERLLSRTGGIIQGMSGSPILQDGKAAGAVTHVFVNDPTKGYGIYLEDMFVH